MAPITPVTVRPIAATAAVMMAVAARQASLKAAAMPAQAEITVTPNPQANQVM